MLVVDAATTIPESDIEWTAVRASGAGGQNVNKVATAVHLRFDSQACAALSPRVKARLLEIGDSRIARDGVIVIKAQRYRTQAQNRRDALERLRDLLLEASARRAPRKPTRPGRAQREARLRDKAHRARVKEGRGKVRD